MIRRTYFLAMMLVLSSTCGIAQEISDDLKAGADFVWELTQIKRPDDVVQHFNTQQMRERIKASVVLNNESKKRLGDIFRSLRDFEMRSPLVPVVKIIDQNPVALDIGNQYVIYRIESKQGGVLFYEVHMMGEDSLIIDEVKEGRNKGDILLFRFAMR